MSIKPSEVVNLRSLWADWPSAQQSQFEAWCAGVGPAARASPPPGSANSVIVYANHYTYAARWAKARGLTDQAPSSFWTKSVVLQLSRELHEDGYSCLSARAYVIALDRVIAATEPEANRYFLARILKTIPRTADSSDKQSRLQDSRALVDLGQSLMQAARADKVRGREAAIRFRRGLQIALLALRPYRLVAFSSFVLIPEEHQGEVRARAFLKRTSDGYKMLYREPKRTVAGVLKRARSKRQSQRPLRGGKHVSPQQTIPDELVAPMCEWLEIWRPLLTDNPAIDALWVNAYGSAQRPFSIYKDVTTLTKEVFGRSLSPKLFRDCLVTSLHDRDPSNDHGGHRLLANTQSVADSHYIHRSSQASIEVGSHAHALTAAWLAAPATVRDV